ncbi:MAG TPA: ATP-binding protein, partial [Thermoleophilaceae bacterium]
ARHAEASSVSVDLRTGDEGTSLVVRDDGRGFDVDRRGPSSRGLGRGGMAERARLVGGELTIDSRPGFGTELSLKVP